MTLGQVRLDGLVFRSYAFCGNLRKGDDHAKKL